MIFHEELRLAGSIDMIYRDKNTNQLVIYDWKRSKKIEKRMQYGKISTTECLNHIPDTNYWHYCMQLNVYKAILLAKYGVSVGDMYLVCLHPNNSNGTYIRLQVADLQDEVSMLFEERKQCI
jgi:hypothetical protein